MRPSDELKALAATLASWSARRGIIIYIFGSRVRGDHRPDSDVDVLIGFQQADDYIDDDWWGETQRTNFTQLKQLLPGPLRILMDDDAFAQKIVSGAAHPFYQDRNVYCVWLPPKPTT